MRIAVIVAFVLGLFTISFSQGTTIKGKVIDKLTREPLPYADVHLVELKKGTITKPDGTFIISGVPDGEYTLEVSYVGYRKFHKKVDVKDNGTTEVNIELEQTVISLPGVIVTGSIYEKSPFEIKCNNHSNAHSTAQNLVFKKFF